MFFAPALFNLLIIFRTALYFIQSPAARARAVIQGTAGSRSLKPLTISQTATAI
jgi:hypothetical protein